MKRIDAIVNGVEHTFRTNNDGCYLFTGVSENKQISCESGFDSLSRIKKAIRYHLSNCGLEKTPRIKYDVKHPEEWRK